MDNHILVVIPCYNAAKYVAEAIASVKAQTFGNWNCVIVDDGSTDNSWDAICREIAGDQRFKAIQTENRGVADARNLGISTASDGYILPLDADDRLMPVALERFAEYWERYPNFTLMVPQIRKFGDGIKVPVVQERQWISYTHLKLSCTPTNSSCFRYRDWKRVGGYRNGTMYEDWEFWLRLLYNNPSVMNIPEVLIEYRSRDGSRWHEAYKRHDKEVAIIKEMNPDIYRHG